ncbi:MAG: hypothetical protein ACRDBR_01270 [Metamycoplasmataceae bacterium]
MKNSNLRNNVIPIILFDYNKISISISEKIEEKMFPLFKREEYFEQEKMDINKIKKFINLAFEDFRQRTKIIIKEVFVLIDQLDYYNVKQEIVSTELIYNMESRLGADVLQNIQRNIKNDWSKKQDISNVISVLPFKFKYVNKNNQVMETSSFPLNKKAMKLTTYFSITTIDETILKRINEIFSNLNIKIKHFLTSSQLAPFKLRKNINNINTKGTFIIEINKKFSAIYYIRNNIVLFSQNISINYKKLVKKISQNFEISKELSENILISHFSKKWENNTKTIFVNFENKIERNKIEEIISNWVELLTFEIKEIINSKTQTSKENIKVFIFDEINIVKGINTKISNILAKNVDILKTDNLLLNMLKTNYLDILAEKFEYHRTTHIFDRNKIKMITAKTRINQSKLHSNQGNQDIYNFVN